MILKTFGNKFILSFEKGDNFFRELLNFFKENSIHLASFIGPGSLLSCELSYNNLNKNDYLRIVVAEKIEVFELKR